MGSRSEALLDTSYIVRYLTDDPPELAERAAKVIDSERVLGISPVVLVETAYVLTRVYHIPREAVVDQLIAFLQKENIVSLHLDKELMIEALLLCRPSGRTAFADALLWAEARASRAALYSFDERFPETGIDLRRE